MLAAVRFVALARRRRQRGTMAAAEARQSDMEKILDFFPLSFPVPSPETFPNLVPKEDIVLEQELLRNPDNQRTWLGYLTHVEDSNLTKRPTPDEWIPAGAVDLLGFFSDASQRLAFQRIVSLYERALAEFPTSYKLWRRYLFARSRFVLGEPRDGMEGRRRRGLQSNNPSLEMGPTLLDMRKEELELESWHYALDGTLGWKEWRSLAAAYERALAWLPTMPRLWLDYLALFTHPRCSPVISRTHARRTFDRALRVLPGSLHLRIWKVYLAWAEMCGGDMARRVWRRYLAVDPTLSERYVAMLLNSSAEPTCADGHRNDLPKPENVEHDDDEDLSAKRQQRVLEASKLLLSLARRAQRGEYQSPDGKSPYHLFIDWLELVERYPDTVGRSRDDEQAVPERSVDDEPPASETDMLDASRLPVERIVSCDGLARFPDQAGRLWTGLATYYIKRGDLDTAQATFEKGMATVLTVRDFTQIFDAYAETCENVLSFMMEELAEMEDGEEDQAEKDEQEAEVDRRMQEFEELMERRPFLVNDVLLRRNPDDVQEWEKRVALWGDQDDKVVETYQKAVDTIQPRKATPNLHQLYINYAKFYEEGGSQGRAHPGSVERDVTSAREIMERAVRVPYKRVDDLAEVWCSWAEMEIRNSNYDEALRVMARATSVPSSYQKIRSVSYYDDSLPPQSRLFKSLKLWAFYTDLEEALGTMQSAKHAFDRIMELKIANAQTIINFAQFLEEQQYFEEAFKVYERGVELFTYPVAFELWNVYLSKFVARYRGTKLERARDLFDQALDKCPAHLCKPLYLKYGELEEEFGLMRKAMTIYERATKTVGEDDRYEVCDFSDIRCICTTSPRRRPTMVWPPRARSTSRQSRSCRTARRPACAFALPCSSASLERWNELVPSMPTHRSSVTPRRSRSFGRSGMRLRLRVALRTRSVKCVRYARLTAVRIKRSVLAQYNTAMANVASSVLAPDAAIQDAATAADPMARLEAAKAAEATTAAPPASGAPSFVAASAVSKPATISTNTEQIEADNDDELL